MAFFSIKALSSICASLLLLLLVSISLRTQSSDDIKMSIEADGRVKNGVPNLRATFRNLRDEEINLYLGTIGGRGPRPCKLDNREVTCSFNFNLSVTDANGRTRKFKFRGMDYVAGRLDPYIVHLQAHSTYTIDLGIDQFWAPDTGDYKTLRLDAGKYDISLQFEAHEPATANLDQTYLKRLSFWKGKLTSNTVTMKIASMGLVEQAIGADSPQADSLFSCVCEVAEAQRYALVFHV
jgi:hypothetical protein